MAKPSPTVESPLVQQLHSLASYVPSTLPVVSLYLNLTPNENGRDEYDAFCRRIFADRLESAAPDERAALEGIFGRIQSYLDSQVQRSANGLAIFASAGPDGLFEAVQLAAPIEQHEFFVGPIPQLFPLVRLIDQNPRYAAVLLDSNQARIIVFGLGEIEGRDEVSGTKTKRHSKGGWSQARFQRSIENAHVQHVKEVVETLDTIVQAEGIQHVVVAGDDVIVARLREELPARLAEKVVDVLRLDRAAGEEEIVADALEALRRKDSETDAVRVAEVIDAWRARGLGVAGREGTRHALERGQVDELLITAAPEEAEVSNELVTRAAQTGASVRIIEDPELLREHGGVAAALRYRV